MKARIIAVEEKKLTGLSMKMSVANNKTSILWKNFLSLRYKITNVINNDLYSLQIYDPDYFTHFDPSKTFIKYALIEVAALDQVPDEMISFTLGPGLYAVFHYKGLPADGGRIFQFIFNEWIPDSDYLLDSRPHFEVLGEKYKNNSPDSEEDIWIPIKKEAK